ncbi:MAG: RDD family protein [Bacilli bacterium]
MKVSLYKRFSAYLIDILLLGLILMLIFYFMPESKNVSSLHNDLNLINENFLNNEIETIEYLNKYSSIMYRLDKDRLIFTIINFIAIFVYFVLVPYFYKGKTLGNYILGLEIKSKFKKLKIKQLIIRNIIINGLGYLLTSIILVLLLNNNSYFYLLSIFAFTQLILVIVSIFMIIYRHDKRGLHDILSQTKVVISKTEVKE